MCGCELDSFCVWRVLQCCLMSLLSEKSRCAAVAPEKYCDGSFFLLCLLPRGHPIQAGVLLVNVLRTERLGAVDTWVRVLGAQARALGIVHCVPSRRAEWGLSSLLFLQKAFGQNGCTQAPCDRWACFSRPRSRGQSPDCPLLCIPLFHPRCFPESLH